MCYNRGGDQSPRAWEKQGLSARTIGELPGGSDSVELEYISSKERGNGLCNCL